MFYHVFNIQFETDGDEPPDLPTELFLEADANDGDVEEQLGSAISDKTGWLHNGFSFNPVSDMGLAVTEVTIRIIHGTNVDPTSFNWPDVVRSAEYVEHVEQIGCRTP
jgi:hypothetical protein